MNLYEFIHPWLKRGPYPIKNEHILYDVCTHPEHNLVSFLRYLQAGEVYRHECPRCGKVTEICGSNSTL